MCVCVLCQDASDGRPPQLPTTTKSDDRNNNNSAARQQNDKKEDSNDVHNSDKQQNNDDETHRSSTTTTALIAGTLTEEKKQGKKTTTICSGSRNTTKSVPTTPQHQLRPYRPSRPPLIHFEMCLRRPPPLIGVVADWVTDDVSDWETTNQRWCLQNVGAGTL